MKTSKELASAVKSYQDGDKESFFSRKAKGRMGEAVRRSES